MIQYSLRKDISEEERAEATERLKKVDRVLRSYNKNTGIYPGLRGLYDDLGIMIEKKYNAGLVVNPSGTPAASEPATAPSPLTTPDPATPAAQEPATPLPASQQAPPPAPPAGQQAPPPAPPAGQQAPPPAGQRVPALAAQAQAPCSFFNNTQVIPRQLTQADNTLLGSSDYTAIDTWVKEKVNELSLQGTRGTEDKNTTFFHI
jgi:hypothetical protein